MKKRKNNSKFKEKVTLEDLKCLEPINEIDFQE